MYRSRLSGPLWDRIDIHIEVQKKRFGKSKTRNNAEMNTKQLRAHCAVDDAGHALLQRCVDRLGMSARAHSRILKVARAIADLEGAENLSVVHLSEAVQYRMLDRKI